MTHTHARSTREPARPGAIAGRRPDASARRRAGERGAARPLALSRRRVARAVRRAAASGAAGTLVNYGFMSRCPRWLFALLTACLLLAGHGAARAVLTLGAAPAVVASQAVASAEAAAVPSNATRLDGSAADGAPAASDAWGSESNVAEAALDAPELTETPRAPLQGLPGALAPQARAEAAVPPPFLEGLQRPPRGQRSSS